MRVKVATFWFGFALSALYGCGGGGGGGDSGGSPAARPRVELTLSAAAARVGDNVTLTWTTQDASSCTASGNWNGARSTSGLDTIRLAEVGNATFILTCTGAGGSASDTETLTAAAAMQQLVIPGAPAPISYSKGACIPEDTADYTLKCITSAAGIASKYDTFTSSTSGRVTFSPNGQPVTTLGGVCTGGFDRVQSQYAVDTTLVDHALPMTGSTIAEIIYKPALLNSITQDVISEMSALMFMDTSNTDRMGILIHATASGDALKIATAGTVSSSGAWDFVQCISDEGGTPPPPPPPAGLTCPAGNGAGVNGLEFFGTTSYVISSAAANQTTPRSVGWGVRYNNQNLASGSYTGSLRVTLWAVPNSFSGGTISGHRLFVGYPNFVGAGARSTNQLYNFSSVSDIQSSGSGPNPPAGRYCIVAALDHFSSSCTSSDGYCYSDWVQFQGAEQFQ